MHFMGVLFFACVCVRVCVCVCARAWREAPHPLPLPYVRVCVSLWDFGGQYSTRIRHMPVAATNAQHVSQSCIFRVTWCQSQHRGSAQNSKTVRAYALCGRTTSPPKFPSIVGTHPVQCTGANTLVVHTLCNVQTQPRLWDTLCATAERTCCWS